VSASANLLADRDPNEYSSDEYIDAYSEAERVAEAMS
jgi:hypothetical protein